MRLTVDRTTIEARDGDSLLEALLRAGLHPTGGGCLCLAGDCPHCLATVDGVSYVRTCQVAARAGQLVERDHLGGAAPPLWRDAEDLLDARPRETPVRHLHCDVVVIGQGEAGVAAADEARAAGQRVITLDAGAGQEAIGVYPGPRVVARTDEATWHVHPRGEIVIATGAAEIQPVAPGSGLEGLLTARAAERLAAASFDLGRVVAVGTPPAGVAAVQLEGEIVRFCGEQRLEAVIVRGRDGVEHRHSCDTVSLGLGLHPRDALSRMGRGLSVRAVGDAARESNIPPRPRDGIVCPCSRVTVADLDSVWQRGFRELELVKRATLAGTGACQGAACLPHLRSFVRDRGQELQPAFTARPVTRQLTLGEVAAGQHHRATPRTALHDEHTALGAQMDRAGGWWRPWTYGDPMFEYGAEYRAVREAVSLGDVSTLGKFEVAGPDALPLLELLYPTQVSTLRPGHCRYVLLLDERGYVLDDGMILCHDPRRYSLTLTSGGASFAELWIRDWAESRGFDVRLLDQTMALGAINVTGPRAAELLGRAGVNGVTGLPGFACHLAGEVAGVACRILRLSFTGELSYELHHPARDSVALWRRLLELGRDLGIRPHGFQTLLDLRLEKGHIVIGKDTDFDSTPRRLGHEWAVRLAKPEFVGRQAVLRTNRIDLDRKLCGFEMAGPPPDEGALIWSRGRYAGTVTSSAASHVLGKTVLLGWLDLEDGELPAEVVINGHEARRVATPFYDPDGKRARAEVSLSPLLAPPRFDPLPTGSAVAGCNRFSRLEATRIVAVPAALDRLALGPSELGFRLAPDELLLVPSNAHVAIDDPHAIVELDTGFAGAWVAIDEALSFLERACSWPIPTARPAFAQGAVAGLPVKLWLETDRVLFVVPAPFAADFEARLR